MATYTQTNRLFRISTPLGGDKLLLKSVRGAERLSTLFEYEARLLSQDNNIDYKQILGKEVTITIDSPVTDGGTRYINGIVRSFGRTGSTGILTNYTAIIVPKLWLATLSSDSRIFQKKSAKTILSDLIKTQAGITDYKDSASDTGDTERPYCVQYRETNFAYVSRLMEEEGIYYHFTHADGKHTLVLCDSPGSHSDAPDAATVPFHNRRALRSQHGVQSWSLRNDTAPGNYTLADYDYTKPTASLRSKAVDNNGNSSSELFDYPGYYTESSEGDKRAKHRLEAHLARHNTCAGATTAVTLATGLTFTLKDHPNTALNQKYLIIENEIYAENPPFTDAEPPTADIFQSRLTAIPATNQYRAPRRTPAPDLRGPHSATVTGAEDDEIHTDKYGSIKVRFHWDRDDEKKGEDSTVFLRAAQLWTGKNYGAIFIPRVGQEVIVEFLDGSPDRPVITGCLYNEDNLPPYELPAHKTRSTIKTHSTPEADAPNAYNEIRIEDQKDSEQIFIHAAKDHDTIVAHDQTAWVGNTRRQFIIMDHEQVVRNNHHEIIGGNHHIVIGNGGLPTTDDRGQTVEDSPHGNGGEHIEIAGPRAIKIGGKSTITVVADVAEDYGKNHATHVAERRFLQAKEIHIETDDGACTLILNEDGIALTTQKDISLKADGNIALKAGGDITLEADGNISQKATGDHKVEATGNASLKGTGGVKIESSANIEAKASAQLTMEGTAGASLKGTAQLQLAGALAELKADGPLTIQGAIVNIN